VIVANLYEMYNFLIKEIEKPIKKVVLIENYRKILILMGPFIPHFSSECLSSIKQTDTSWPVVSKEEIVEQSINFVVQINGKKRSEILISSNTLKEDVIIMAKSDTKILTYLKDKEIVKEIYVEGRIVNIVVK